jgi:hypothetical protein
MNLLKLAFPILASVTLLSCDHKLKHERIIKNSSLDTVTIFNPDFKDTSYTLLPGEQALIYEFENLDTKQEKEPCRWLGDTLVIKTIHDSLCTKSPAIEGNWVSVMGGTDKARKQTCTLTLEIGDFGDE